MKRLRTAGFRACSRTFLFAGILFALGCREDVRGLNSKALEQMAAGNLDAAEKTLQEAIGIASEQGELYANLAELHARQNRYEEARKDQALAVKFGAEPVLEHRKRLAEYFILSGNPVGAVDTLVSLRKDAPGDPEIARSLCIAYLRGGSPDRAASALTEALRDFPDDPGIQAIRARFLLRDKREEEALGVLEALVQKHPELAEAHLLLGDLHLARRNLALAIEHYRMAAGEEGSPELNLKLGKALAQAGEPAEAEARLRKVADPAFHGEAWIELADLYYRNPNDVWPRTEALSRAMSAVEHLLEIDPLNVRAHTLKGMIHARRGQIGPMINEFDTSVTIDPAQDTLRDLVQLYRPDETETSFSGTPGGE